MESEAILQAFGVLSLVLVGLLILARILGVLLRLFHHRELEMKFRMLLHPILKFLEIGRDGHNSSRARHQHQ